jgi:hypothetical protein
VSDWLFVWPHRLVWYLFPAIIVAASVVSWVVEDAKKGRRQPAGS